MTTPNVEELITYLQGLANEIEIPYPMEVIEEAAEVLQSQAERIAELERESETHSKAYGLAIVERDTLRAQLTAIAATEPVSHQFQTADGGWHPFLDDKHYHNTVDDGRWPIRELFTRPMPAQRLTELKLLMLTTAYEQGVGKGIQRRDCNPYAADTDEHAAWALGYEEGLGLRRI